MEKSSYLILEWMVAIKKEMETSSVFFLHRWILPNCMEACEQ